MMLHKIKGMSKLILTLRQSIVIETAKTPNPNFIKFIPVGHNVLGDQGTLDIPSVEYSDVRIC
jgi:hypothetical protein